MSSSNVFMNFGSCAGSKTRAANTWESSAFVVVLSFGFNSSVNLSVMADALLVSDSRDYSMSSVFVMNAHILTSFTSSEALVFREILLADIFRVSSNILRCSSKSSGCTDTTAAVVNVLR